jgi:hypothetical protein
MYLPHELVEVILRCTCPFYEGSNEVDLDDDDDDDHDDDGDESAHE